MGNSCQIERQEARAPNWIHALVAPFAGHVCSDTLWPMGAGGPLAFPSSHLLAGSFCTSLPPTPFHDFYRFHVQTQVRSTERMLDGPYVYDDAS